MDTGIQIWEALLVGAVGGCLPVLAQYLLSRLNRRERYADKYFDESLKNYADLDSVLCKAIYATRIIVHKRQNDPLNFPLVFLEILHIVECVAHANNVAALYTTHEIYAEIGKVIDALQVCQEAISAAGSITYGDLDLLRYALIDMRVLLRAATGLDNLRNQQNKILGAY